MQIAGSTAAPSVEFTPVVFVRGGHSLDELRGYENSIRRICDGRLFASMLRKIPVIIMLPKDMCDTIWTHTGSL
jgi:hypothetical protein